MQESGIVRLFKRLLRLQRKEEEKPLELHEQKEKERLTERLKRFLRLEKEVEKPRKIFYIPLEEPKGWKGHKAKHKMAAKRAWKTRYERRLKRLEKKKRKSMEEMLEAKRLRKHLLEVRRALRKRKKQKIKKPKISRERRERRKKIGKKLEKKLIEAGRKRKKKEELEKYGAMKVKEVETIEGKEPIKEEKKPVRAGKLEPEEFKPGEKPFDRSAFYIRSPSKDLALMERKRWVQARVRTGAKPRPSERLREIIKEKSGAELNEARLSAVEERLSEVMQRSGLNEREIERDIERLDTNRLLRDFDKLISLIELEKKAKKEIRYAPEIIETGVPHFERQKERIKTIAKEIKKHRLITDVDRVYSYIKQRRRAKSKKIAKDLNIPKKKVEEYAEILAANNLVELKYPPIGGLMLVLRGEKRVKK